MEYVLKTNELKKEYRSFKALNGVTMNVPKGSIYGFVGRNGSGKTTLIRVICQSELKDTLIQEIFKHTTTAGIRETKVERSVLERSVSEVETSYGTIRRKEYSGYVVTRSKYEYDD